MLNRAIFFIRNIARVFIITIIIVNICIFVCEVCFFICRKSVNFVENVEFIVHITADIFHSSVPVWSKKFSLSNMVGGIGTGRLLIRYSTEILTLTKAVL